MGGDQKTRGVTKHGTQHKSEDIILKEINEEIMSLHEYLEKQGISGEEFRNITQPLVNAVNTAAFKKWAVKSAKLALLVGLIIAAFILLWQVECIHRLINVAGRFLLMMLLPYWDWTKIYNSDCVLTNPYFVSRSLGEDDCNVCESLEHLDRLSNVSIYTVAEDYLKNDVPFIVVDAMADWPVMNTEDFWFDNVTELYLKDDLRHIRPCELTSNLRLRYNDLRSFLHKIHNPDVRRWYGHWENCDKKAAKALRPIYKRPYFIPHMVDLSDSNWVLISSNYKGKIYKELDYQTELLWVAQVRGYSRIRLVPRDPCDHYCSQIIESLTEGDMVVLTNMMWRFEYIPGEHTDNLAIAVGGFWN